MIMTTRQERVKIPHAHETNEQHRERETVSFVCVSRASSLGCVCIARELVWLCVHRSLGVRSNKRARDGARSPYVENSHHVLRLVITYVRRT